MLSLSTITRSDLESLLKGLSSRESREEFLSAIHRFLKSTPVDGGADSDLIYMVGKRLSEVGVWQYLPPKDFASTMQTLPVAATDLLLERAEPAYRRKVREHLDQLGSFKIGGVSVSEDKVRVISPDRGNLLEKAWNFFGPGKSKGSKSIFQQASKKLIAHSLQTIPSNETAIPNVSDMRDAIAAQGEIIAHVPPHLKEQSPKRKRHSKSERVR